jgi:hypothetical protein
VPVRKQYRRSLPAITDSQAYLTDVGKVEPETVEHMAILAPRDRSHRRGADTVAPPGSAACPQALTGAGHLRKIRVSFGT